MNSSILSRVIKVIVEAAHLGPEAQLDAETPLIGGGISLDSVAVLEVLMALEAEFDVEITAVELVEAQALMSVGRLATFMERKTSVAG